MASTSEHFHFAYAIQGTIGDLKLEDGDPSTNHVNPVATDIDVTDPDGGKIHYNDPITGSVHGTAVTDDFVFISQASVKDDHGRVKGIVVEDKDTGQLYFLTNDPFQGELHGKHGVVKLTSAHDTFCFMAGTMICTPDGEVPVESLKRGDLVSTRDGRSVAVDWLGVQTVSLRFADKMRVLPIRIRAGAIAENVPKRDLLLSPDHAILVEGALIQAGALVNGTSIVRETDVPNVFTYYHVEVEDHSLVLAENTPAETFVDNVDRLGFDNWAEHEAAYPNGKHVEELPYPRAKSHRQVPVGIRVMLGARAQEIGATDGRAAVA